MMPSPLCGGPRRAGAALATAVLFALVVLMAGHGVLLVSRTQRWIAASDGARWMGDEQRSAALLWATAGLDSLPSPGPRSTPWGPIQVERPTPELAVLRIEPDSRSPGTGWAALLASPTPVPRVVNRSGAARVAGPVFETGTSMHAGGSDEVCPPELVGWAAPRIGRFPEGGPRLGVLDFEDILGALPTLSGGRLELPASPPSACEDVPAFGDPDRPGVCSGVWGAGTRYGDLVLSGRGQGVLAVDGDLTLVADAHFRGWVWVGGTLRIAAGTDLRGLADVGGSLVVEPGGTFSPDGCAGVRALEAAPDLRRPHPVGPRMWPLFRP